MSQSEILSDCNQKMAKFVTNAIVLGYSLKKHCRVQERLLLVTEDVCECEGYHLLNIYWKIRTIKHVQAAESRLISCEDRFRGVFNKARAWELTEYRQIVVLDLQITKSLRIEYDALFAF